MIRKFALFLVAALALISLCAAASCALETGTLLVAAENDGAYVFVAGENLFLVRYKALSATFEWSVHPVSPSARMRVANYDQDGENEIALAFYMGGGTGVSYDSLYIVKSQDGRLTDYDYASYGEDIEAIKRDISFRAFKEGSAILAEFAYGKNRLRFDVTGDMGGGSVDTAAFTHECGDQVAFMLAGGGIELKAPLGVRAGGSVVTEYYAEVRARVLFADGGFSLADIRIIPDTSRVSALRGINSNPRQATALSTKNPTYNKIIREYLARNGLPDAEPNIVQIFKVDLEGDGVDEVVICAQNILDNASEAVTWEPGKPLSVGAGFPEGSKKGQYSLILLRKVVDGKVREIPLDQFIALKDGGPIDPVWSPPYLHKIYQFVDLNGDGVMEIITGEDSYESYSYSLFEIKGDKAVRTLLEDMGI